EDQRAAERAEQHDDVAGPPFGQHQRSVCPHDQDGDAAQTGRAERRYPAHGVVRPVRREEENRQHRRDGPQDTEVHGVLVRRASYAVSGAQTFSKTSCALDSARDCIHRQSPLTIRTTLPALCSVSTYLVASTASSSG